MRAAILPVVGLLVAGYLALGSEDEAAILWARIKQADAAHDIAAERRLLDQAAAVQATAKERGRFERRLAVLQWKYDRDVEGARERLRAAAIGTEATRAWLALCRLELEVGTPDAAVAAADQARAIASVAGARRAARRASARAVVERAVRARRAGGAGVDEALRAVWQELLDDVRAEPGELGPSRLLLRAGVLLEEWPSVLTAWRSYYQVAPGLAAPNTVIGAGERLAAACGDPSDGGEAQRTAQIEALAESLFFEAAALAALAPAAPTALRQQPRVREVLAYAALLRDFEVMTEDYYRLTALGRGDKTRYREALAERSAAFFEALGVESSGDADARLERLSELADERFRAMINFGMTAGYYDLHMGHRAIDDRRTVEQYGKRADVRFISLDTIVSNGFQSWAWEDGGQHGGWATAETIIQVRPAYADGPLRTWRQMHAPSERGPFEQELARESELDWSRAAKDRHAYLPGLRLRMRRQGLEALLSRLREQGLEGDGLRAAFIAELQRAIQESSIFAHEGRHAIDNAGPGRSAPGWQKEFTAKLSEVAFAPEPRLSLGGILSANIGSDSPHGRANLKVMEGLVEWMSKHRAEIEGLERERPLLPQLDRLTNEQLRNAFRSMDPLANE
ncbi:MAG: hypothetical protein AAF628_13015 [Planctomycetota bacterium]